MELGHSVGACQSAARCGSRSLRKPLPLHACRGAAEARSGQPGTLRTMHALRSPRPISGAPQVQRACAVHLWPHVTNPPPKPPPLLCNARTPAPLPTLQQQNVNDLATYAIQVAIAVMHLGRLSISSDWLSILAAAQCILLLLRLQYFSR